MSEYKVIAMPEATYKEYRRKSLDPNEKAGIAIERRKSKWSGASVVNEGRLGVIAIDAPLGNGWFSYPYDYLSAQVESLEEDDNVEAIAFDINSPGGDISGLFELMETIGRCVKPVYAYCEGACASAAYALATSAQKIYATESTRIGSIGVMAVYLNDDKYMQKLGLEEIIFRSEHAEKKNLDPKSSEGKEQILKSLNEAEKMFIGRIANNRGVTSDDVYEKFGRGLMFHSAEALERGMVDGIVADFASFVEKIMPSSTEGGGVEMAEEKTLTIEAFKAQHPELAAKVIEEGRLAGMDAGKAEGLRLGAEAERERISGLNKLRQLACAAEVVEKAIADGTSVADAKSAILDKQIEAAQSGQTAEPPKGNVTLEELADESAQHEVNPKTIEVDSRKASIESDADTVSAAFLSAAGIKKE